MIEVIIPAKIKNPSVVVKISEEDKHLLSERNYYTKFSGKGSNRRTYIARGISFQKPCGKWSVKTWYLHWDIARITSPSRKVVVDHINGDTLDNRRENLRVVHQWENIINGKLGRDEDIRYLSFGKKSKVWTVVINGKYIYSGKCFEIAKTKRDAYLASPEYQAILLERQKALALYEGAQ